MRALFALLLAGCAAEVVPAPAPAADDCFSRPGVVYECSTVQRVNRCVDSENGTVWDYLTNNTTVVSAPDGAPICYRQLIDGAFVVVWHR